jgi:arylsulfatase
MKTHLLFRVSVLVLFLLPAGLVAQEGALPQKKIAPQNVVLVTIDTLRADHLSVNGYFRDAAPFLNSLARRGMNFSQAFTCSSHTAPSHASMFTSLYPFEHRVRRNLETLHHKTFTVASYMKEQGYAVAGFSAVQFLEGRVGFPELDKEYQWEDTAITKKFWYRNAEQNVTRVTRWLSRQKSSDKFFIWIHFYDVHEWMKRSHIPAEFLTHFDGETGDAVQTAVEKSHGPAAKHFKKRDRFFWAINRYDARLRYVDHHLHQLFQYMNKNSFNENTLWVVTSDHGEGLNNHNYLYHGEFLYQEQLRVPLFFFDTGQAPSRQVHSLARTVDIFPTIADLIGHPLNKDTHAVRGLSLASNWEDGGMKEVPQVRYSLAERRPRDATKWHRGWKEGEVFSLHDLESKMIYHSAFDDEFFDLNKDSYELQSSEQGERYKAWKRKLESITGGKKQQSTPAPAAPAYDTQAVEELTALGYL